ncbi:hypothetical protein HXA31_09510 [Salipaludibacillus agaradhaerens]|uniref:DUF4064 domain-containing protein n=1 Tax=Salipaludibacillus agaradhaerens TaxID=76935 RepID=A0A9Q4B0N3_SALAG|nr:hypothetical protein [Salipaludibacillus agaradhaerens]MCR6095830.1 hypothetical protein [Salipaludibacillus agaradhaerens]MCR6114610.1 hypothetical protein [Salipaludibacillus agaradhaerens]
MTSTRFYSGLIGGILGFIFTFYAVYYGTTDEIVFGESFLMGSSMIAMGLSTIAIISACMIRLKPRFSSWTLVISGLLIPFFISTYGFVPLVFLLISGIPGIRQNN